MPSIRFDFENCCDCEIKNAFEKGSDFLFEMFYLDTIDLNQLCYQWVESSVAGEYYLTDLLGNQAEIIQPSYLTVSGSRYINGVLGTLNDSEYAWGDNDTLGFDTLYIRLPQGSNPIGYQDQSILAVYLFDNTSFDATMELLDADSEVVFTLSNDNGLIILGGTNSKITLDIPADNAEFQDLPVGKYKYSLVLTDGTVTRKVMHGDVQVVDNG